MQTDIDALEPRPDAIGIVDRRAYRHPGKEGLARERKMYMKQEAAFWCTFRSASGKPSETSARCGFMAATSSGSRDVTKS